MHVTISRVIHLGALMTVVLTSLMLWSGVAGLAEVSHEFRSVTEDSLPSTIQLADISRAMDVARIKQGLQVTAEQPSDVLSVDKDIIDNIATADKGLAAYNTRLRDPAERAIFSKVQAGWKILRAQTLGVRDMALRGDMPAAAHIYRGLMVKVAVDLRKTLNGQIAYNRKVALARAAHAARAADRTRIGLAIGGGLALVMAVVLACVLRQRVLVPIKRLVQAMERMADGQLDAEVPGHDRHDEIGASAGPCSTSSRGSRRGPMPQRKRNWPSRCRSSMSLPVRSTISRGRISNTASTRNCPRNIRSFAPITTKPWRC
jgi:methyl-accepting chemotaxis protein